MDFLTVIRDFCKKGSDTLGLSPEKLNKDQLTNLDSVTYNENGLVKFNAKLLFHLKEQKNREIVYFLKQHEDACYTVDSSGATLLHYSAQYHNAKMTERFINKGFNIDTLDNNGNTPLLYAVSVESAISDKMTITETQKLKDTVEVLLREGANMHMTNKSGSSVLPIVFRYSGLRYTGIVNMFLNKVNEESPNNYQVMSRKLFAADCPLPLALRLGGVELTRHMLELGCSVNSFNRITGESALHEAVKLSDLGSVKLLLKNNANVNALDFDKKPPLMKYDTKCDESKEMIAILENFTDIISNLDIALLKKFLSNGKKKTVIAITKRGCDFFVRNQRNETPIHFLARNPNPGIIEEVLRGKYFEINARDKHGNTALMDAVVGGNTHAVEYLLTCNADVNIANCDGLTPLHAVFYLDLEYKNNYVEIVDLLLHHGAKIQCDTRKETILDFGSNESYQRLIAPVLAHLAKVEADGKTIDKEIRVNLDAYEVLKNQFIVYQQQLAEMKMYTVYELVTLYDLLIDSDDKIKMYAGHQEFIYNLEGVMNNKYMSTYYYVNFIKKRVAKAVGILEAENASASMCSVM